LKTLKDIDALLGEAQETQNELNGLERIPETVDEVIEVLFGDEEGIVGRHPFAEGAACECEYVDYELFHPARGIWVEASELECEVPRTDIGVLAKYNAAYRGILDGLHPGPPSAGPPSAGPPSAEPVYDAYGNRVSSVTVTNARHDYDRQSLRSRVERTAQLADAHERWVIARSAMEQATSVFRRMNMGARQAAAIFSSPSFQNAQREFLEGRSGISEFEAAVGAILSARLGQSFELGLTPVASGEVIQESDPDVEIHDFGGGRWTIHRHTAGEGSPWNADGTIQGNSGRIRP
jgi:hypothetical protein